MRFEEVPQEEEVPQGQKQRGPKFEEVKEERPGFFEGLVDVPLQAIKGAVQGLGSPYDMLKYFTNPEVLKNLRRIAGLTINPAFSNLPGVTGNRGEEGTTPSDVIEQYAASPEGKEIRETLQENVGKPAKEFIGMLPGSNEIGEAIEPYIGQPKNPVSAGYHRLGQLGTGSLFFPGGFNLKGPGAAAFLGQVTEEFGGGPIAQSAAEAIGFILSGYRNLPVRANDARIQERIGDLREAGFSEEALTMAKSGMEKHGLTESIAKPTKASRAAFDTAVQDAKQLSVETVAKSLPGFEGGPAEMKDHAISLLENIENEARNFKITKTGPATRVLTNLQDEIRRTLAMSPKREEMIDFVQKAKDTLNKRRVPYEIQEKDSMFYGPTGKRIFAIDKKTGKQAGFIDYFEPSKDNVVLSYFMGHEKATKSEGRVTERGTSSMIMMKHFLDKMEAEGKNVYITGLSTEGHKFTEQLFGREFPRKPTTIYPEVGTNDPLYKFAKSDKALFDKKYDRLIDKLEPLQEPIPGDYGVNFYRDINASGNWESPALRERVLNMTKDAVVDLFRQQGPKGAKFATKFRMGNNGYKNYIYADEINTMFQKATDDIGGVNRINFTKLSKEMADSETFKALEKQLGKTQAAKLRLIAKGGQSIQLLEKRIAGGTGKSIVSAGKYLANGIAIANMDWRTLIAALGIDTASRISTNLLTNPRLQNLDLKLINALKKGQYGVANSITQKIISESEEKKPPFKP